MTNNEYHDEGGLVRKRMWTPNFWKDLSPEELAQAEQDAADIEYGVSKSEGSA